MLNKITTIKENTVFQNKYIEVQNNDVKFSDDKDGKYIKIIENSSKNPGIVVCCIDEDNRYLLINIFRYAIDKNSLEFVRGYSDNDENFVDSAKRELKEETGIKYNDMLESNLLGSFYVNSANILSEIPVIYIKVKNNSFTTPQIDEHIDQIIWKDSLEIKNMIKNAEIKDSFTLNAYLLLNI